MSDGDKIEPFMAGCHSHYYTQVCTPWWI